MTEAQARARLERMVAAAVAPTLDAADVDDLMLQAKRPDLAGRAPSDIAWTPTWDLDAAAAAGWEVKAGRAVAFDFTADGQNFRRSQTYDQCMRQARLFRRGYASAAVT